MAGTPTRAAFSAANATFPGDFAGGDAASLDAAPFTADYLGRHPAVPPEEAAQNLLTIIDTLTPAQTGGFYDWQGKEIPW